LNFLKSKKEIEIERKIRARKVKILLQNYVTMLEHLQKKIFKLGVEAKRLNDHKLTRRQAVKLLAIESRINQAKRLLLIIEEAEAERELVSISSSFITFANDIIKAIAEGPDASKLAKLQAEFEKAIEKSESLEEMLSIIVDSANESILSSGNFNDENIAKVMKLLEDEVDKGNYTSIDIEERIKKIEDDLKW
jgi:nitrogen regulatory protein PII-like uncharacterized protein